MTLCTIPTLGLRPQVRERRPGRPPSGKRLSMMREMPAKVRSAIRRSLDPCDSSNDSGLGFDHHTDPNHLHQMGIPDRVTWNGERTEAKRPRMDIKVEHEDANDRYCFPDTLRNSKDNSTALIRTAPVGSIPSLSMSTSQTASSGRAVPRCIPLSGRQASSSPIPLTMQLTSYSRYMDVNLTIVKQPEQQHRARYQTEGSRGAVKDRDGNGFPIVQLTGYYQPTTLQVFIGTDVGKVAPHMFYQACKVSGKNSTPCIEKKVDGTCVIELQLDPSKEMSATCDCVGILKERNVDVEHRFPEQLGNRSKKKSTRCRMIFRTTLTHEDGSQETLQVCSQPIVCTQPPGVPEICKKSLTSCPASGGLELFVLGKNFLKDTKVCFQEVNEDRHIHWEQTVLPDKEYLQQTHFVCVVPPFRNHDITEPVTVRLFVMSSGKTSESHQFVYTPVNGAIPSVHVDASPAQQTQFFNKVCWPPSINKREQDLGMMPPPESSMVPMTRRSSISIPSTSEVHSPPLRAMKQEYIDENSQNSVMDSMELRSERYRHISESSLDVHHGDSNMSMINENSMDILNHNSMINNNDNSNLSMTNENSMEVMMRRNSLSRPMSGMCDNSMDVNLSNSQMSNLTDDSCSAAGPMHSTSTSVSDRLVLSQPSMLHSGVIPSSAIAEELKGIDLRTKMPLATVTDLVCSNAPSMATLHRFGVTEASTEPLLAQSAQSIENYLTNIETKPATSQLHLKPDQLISTSPINSFATSPSLLLSNQTCRSLLTTTTNSNLTTLSASGQANAEHAQQQPVFLSPQRSFLSNTTQGDTAMMVAKSEAAAIAESTLPAQTIAPTITATLVNGITAQINTERLDDFVNSTVESHIGSPTRSETAKSNVLLSSKDVMLNSRALVIPSMINTTLAASPIMSQADLNNSHNSPNLSPEVILNSQISPSLMCRNSQDTLTLPPAICQTTSVDTGLLPIPQQTSPNTLHSPIPPNPLTTLVSAGGPEQEVLFKAAVDLMETQKKIKQMDGIDEIITMASNTATTETQLSQLQANNNFGVQQPPFTASTQTTTVGGNKSSEYVIPVPVKEMAAVTDKKQQEDRMIPQSFTSLTENELINLINPSCFDQGNSSNYQ